MKKLFCIIIAATLLLACGSKSGGKHGENLEDNLEETVFSISEVKLAKEVSVVDKDGAPKCRISLEVKYVKGNDKRARNINNAIEEQLFRFNDLTMQQAVDSFANVYTSEYRENMSPLYREEDDKDTNHAWYEFRYELETDTQDGKDDCLVYIAELSMYEGGAHGIEGKLAFNFDKKTGRQITCEDIFVKGYEHRLEEILLKKLMEQTNTHSLEELQEEGYLFSMDFYVSQNFILGKKSITFIYNPYEIAAYALGRTELVLSYSELKAIMK